MPVEPGWEVSPDKTKDYNYIRARLFEPFEVPILTTKMERSDVGAGFAVLTNMKFYYCRKASAGAEAASIIGGGSSGEWEDKIPLQNITRIEYYERGKYLLYWMKLDRHGNPKLDKLGNYKTVRAKFQVLASKAEEDFKYLERREQFGYFLQRAINKSKGNV